jgi:SutA RNAP-binding domain
MARKPTRAAAKKKQPAAVETSQSIEEQTKLFLKSGQKIQVIQSGISGQQSMAPSKHIKLGNKTAAS